MKQYDRNYGDPPPEKLDPLVYRLSRSFKVIGTDTDRSATYDFLLVIHSNHGPVAYRFNRFFFTSRVEEVLLRFCIGDSAQKTRVMPLPTRWKDFDHVTDGQNCYNSIALCTLCADHDQTAWIRK